MVSGTVIGAGMLALPLSSHSIGFIFSSIIMIYMFIIALLSSLNIAKINMYVGKSTSIPLAARKILGRPAEIIAIISKLLLLYSLLSAYISGSVEIIHSELSVFYNLNISVNFLAIIFVSLLGFFVASKFKAADYINKIGCYIMLSLFILMFVSLINKVNINNLSYIQRPTSLNLATTSLLFFTSFWFSAKYSCNF